MGYVDDYFTDKKIVLVAGSPKTTELLYEQITEYLPKYISIEPYAIDNGISSLPENIILILSSNIIKKELIDLKLMPKHCDIIICNRTINFEYLDKLIALPEGEEVLFVNDAQESVEQGIKGLLDLNIDHVKYHPYYPGIEEYKKLDIAITPGETERAPDCVKNIIDIGSRTLDFAALYKIMKKLKLNELDADNVSKKYIKKIINVSKRLSTAVAQVKSLNSYLNNIVQNLSSGILVYSEEGTIVFANEQVKNILNIKNKNVDNKNIKNLVSKDLLKHLLARNSHDQKTIILNDKSIKLSKINISNSKLTIATLLEEVDATDKQSLRKELVLKGHYAKYKFEDIIGESKTIKETIFNAKKLGNSDLTMLIEGESGTGKELFASAIHNESSRRNGPFLAVNFSALPEELVESEIFGYEEGAFTGAKKGGKIGLFELADGGTIFLDEIGDISPKVQQKLLRVIQEKEVMLLGGSNIKKIDVRVIAATNRNLLELVEKKLFRADLYYRLKIGYVYIPPLRERKTDIVDLVNCFIRNETSAEIYMPKEIIENFSKFKWSGNIRELKNTIKYMLAVRDSNVLKVSNMPDKNFFENNDEDEKNRKNVSNFDAFLNDCSENSEFINNENREILLAINELLREDQLAGREKISHKLISKGINLSQHKVRTRLETLEKKGYIHKDKGKIGTKLTEKGNDYVKRIFDKN